MDRSNFTGQLYDVRTVVYYPVNCCHATEAREVIDGEIRADREIIRCRGDTYLGPFKQCKRDRLVRYHM